MKITIISFSFVRGGAAIAAQKFARLENKLSDVTCYCADNSNVAGLSIICSSKLGLYAHFVKRIISFLLLKLMKDGNSVKHSMNLFSSSNALKGIEKARMSDSVLNIHWFNNDTLSIWRLSLLPKSTIITLHDEWLYCGAEHCYPIGNEKKEQFRSGYIFRQKKLTGLNWNYLIWKIKYKKLKERNDLIYTVPSNWMLNRAKNSDMLKGKDIRLLPNPIETERYYQLEPEFKTAIRQKWGMVNQDIVIAIGAIDGEKNYLKGGVLSRIAFSNLKNILEEAELNRIKVVLFGGPKNGYCSYEGFSAINLGRIATNDGMREVYNAADFVMVPSLVESFGQVAAESLACSTPVVAFSCSGLLDVIKDKKHGYLADPFDPISLSNCIARMVKLSSHERVELGVAGRKHILEHFSKDVVGKMYKNILEDAFKK